MKCHLHPDRDAVGYCVSCGQGVCAECRHEVAGTLRCPTHVAAPAPIVVPPPVKSGFLAGLFSVMFPGMGHLYVGAYRRALRFGAIAVGLILVLSMGNDRFNDRLAPLFGLSLFFVWAFALFDAIRVAHEINAGTYLVAPTGDGRVAAARPTGTGTLTLGIILLGIGGLIAVDRYMDLDRFFDWIGDNIGFVFIALGVVLIAAYARRRGKEKDRELAAAPPPADISGPSSSFLK